MELRIVFSVCLILFSYINFTEGQEVPSLQLECTSNSLKATFNVSELQAQLLPYSIKFTGNNTCDSINASSINHIIGDQVWIASSYESCGIEAYHEGNKIAFEQTILVEYGSRSQSTLVYRYFNASYKVQCVLDRNLTTKLDILIKDRRTVQDEDGVSGFKLELEVSDADTNENVQGVARIGEKLRFGINLLDPTNTVKTSPQNCYATRSNGTGRYNLISNRCAGQDDDTTLITSPSNAIHEFSWELLAFRYFGSSDAVVITCEVLICKNEPFLSLSDECKRCGQASNRRRREQIDEVDSKESIILGKSYVSTPPIYIIERQAEAGNKEDFLAKPEGISIIAIIALFVLVLCIVLIKRTFFSPSLSTKNKQIVESGFDNPAMQ